MTSEDRRIMWGLSNAVVCDTGIGEIRQLKLIVFWWYCFLRDIHARSGCSDILNFTGPALWPLSYSCVPRHLAIRQLGGKPNFNWKSTSLLVSVAYLGRRVQLDGWLCDQYWQSTERTALVFSTKPKSCRYPNLTKSITDKSQTKLTGYFINQ
jgi:hypothetical protein